ncbi:PhoX family phosphatase [Desertifilum sp. FACHB-1129]|uniref:Phosphatase n=1 Tax=Desertifilum tharense IPPAS B-1220 TaxID=1781255 RepID=A0A1E5QCE1_9CYAN|nr:MULTISPECIES: PhoX family phosphatase [Desertifilum]MBD2312076.1 PhoX family phosphatase [Desertifilum sp. FACHB-1129]MBD2322263.1 PhoX family phosphatase [Desertifilum sp. FACHB-866]MBD2332300.1 PhoX family phosphatase [Desertifilum sp. FACHB-868]OEJ72342.1 phosphatase [Desertifilum tharense IPPAS B-1220]
MIHDNGSSNRSGNRSFEDVLRVRMSRRSAIARGAALSATGFLAAFAGEKLLTPDSSIVGQGSGRAIAQGRSSSLMNFAALPAANSAGVMPSISADYQFDVLIPWGTPLQPGGPTYDGNPSTRPTSAQQAQQVGIGHDGMWFFPIGSGSDRGMLAINHEYGTNSHVLGKAMPGSLEDVRLSQHAHGVAVVEIAKVNGKWQVVSSNNARRIHGNTPVTFSGPAANSPLLSTPAGNPPLGTLNNCANGKTPWGTYLTCEENFNGYFGATGAWTRTEAQARYGFSAGGFGYGWHNFDPRFDLSNPSYTHEENRFGWVVEIDPMNASQVPVKRTALGRFKHENAELVVGQGGRAVVYMGDDERFDYIYKFVSDSNWRSLIARGISPLDQGKLYVAKFNDNGTGNWIELSIDNPALKAKFANQAEILTYTRIAADTVGATPMDRPEWIAAAPNGDVYCTLTNNTQRREANAPNPLAPNPFGHIIKWRDSNNHVGTTFTWDIFVLAQNTHRIDQSAFGSPDGLWADPDGRLFIQTDGTQPVVNGVQLNDQMLVADPTTGEIRRIFAGVTGCEVTGITVTPDRRTMFVNLQHPGDGDPNLTSFPAEPGSGRIPRDATIVITKKNGGVIGS